MRAVKESTDAVTARLLAAYDTSGHVDPITTGDASFTMDDAYDVLAAIERDRLVRGWRQRPR